MRQRSLCAPHQNYESRLFLELCLGMHQKLHIQLKRKIQYAKQIMTVI